jgi:signal transduction histidine kinase
MRERVAMLGGKFTAGPQPGGGFRVHAVIPRPGTPPAATKDEP